METQTENKYTEVQKLKKLQALKSLFQHPSTEKHLADNARAKWTELYHKWFGRVEAECQAREAERQARRERRKNFVRRERKSRDQVAEIIKGLKPFFPDWEMTYNSMSRYEFTRGKLCFVIDIDWKGRCEVYGRYLKSAHGNTMRPETVPNMKLRTHLSLDKMAKKIMEEFLPQYINAIRESLRLQKEENSRIDKIKNLNMGLAEIFGADLTNKSGLLNGYEKINFRGGSFCLRTSGVDLELYVTLEQAYKIAAILRAV